MAAQIVPSSPNPLFDGNVNTVFETTLTSAASPIFANLVPGELYYATLIQDAIGGHLVTWPANVFRATAVDVSPLSRTVYSFVALSNANLYPTSPATYN